jgi:acetyl esterase
MKPQDLPPQHGADLDPEIRRFVQTVGAAFASHVGFETMPPQQQRAVAEDVRAPWAAGGPRMFDTFELQVSTPEGYVRIRVHNPTPRPRKAALVYLHGGGWTLFSIDTHDRVMREYAARAEVTVVGVDYALAPEARFPIALNQVVDVVRWLRTHSDVVSIDPERIAIGGDSAGANLSIAAALSLRDQGEPQALRALVLNYGAFDDHCSENAQRRFGGAGYMLASDEMANFWKIYVGENADCNNPLVCPIRAQLDALPPTFFAIPQCDLLTEQNLEMAERLRLAGVPVEAVLYEGASHSFLEAVSISGLSQRAFEDTSAWLRKTLSRE